jgi:hypothetical protein
VIGPTTVRTYTGSYHKLLNVTVKSIDGYSQGESDWEIDAADLAVGNPKPKMPAVLYFTTTLVVSLIMPKAWSVTETPAIVAISNPTLPLANVPVLESP